MSTHRRFASVGLVIAAVTALNGVLIAPPAPGSNREWSGRLVEVPTLESEAPEAVEPLFAAGAEATVVGVGTAGAADVRDGSDALRRPVTRTEVMSERAADRRVFDRSKLIDTVRPTGVEEDIVLASPAAGSRFEFAVSGATAKPDGPVGGNRTITAERVL